MSLALDIGCSEFRSLRRQGNRFIARRTPAVYCVFDATPAQQRLLDQLHVPYSNTQQTLLVIGDAAIEVSRVLGHPLVPLIANGQFPYHDPIGRQVCVTLVESLIPVSARNSLCLTCLPVAAMQERDELHLIDHVVRLRGYQVNHQHPARAVILSELEDAGYTGIGITVGAESVSLAVTHLGQTQYCGSFGRGARSIEESFARARHKYLWDKQGNKYLDVQNVRDWQRKQDCSLINCRNGDEQFLAEAYYRLLVDAFSAMLPEMLRMTITQPTRQSLPLVLSGGPTRLEGFTQLMLHAIENSRLPYKITETRLATYDPYTVARGLFIEATLQSQTQDESAVA